ncbi:MAG: DUF3352 domain-containing protein [Synechococcus sp.]
MKPFSLTRIEQPQWLVKGLAIASAAVVFLVALTFLLILKLSPLALRDRPAVASDIIRLAPRDTVLAATLDAPLLDVERLNRYLTPFSERGPLHRQWQQWISAEGKGPLSEFLSATQLRFDRDFRPWLGRENLLAVTATNGELPDYFVALSTQDLQRSNFLLNVLWQQQYLQQQDPQVEVYKGVQLLSVPVGDRDWAVGAVGNRYVLLATGSDVARGAIDSWQMERLSLASTPIYRDAAAERSTRLGLVYVNLPDGLSRPQVRGEDASAAEHLETLWDIDWSVLQTADNQPTLLKIGVSARQLDLMPLQAQS